MRTRSIWYVIGGGALVVGLTASPASAAEQSSRGRCISELAQAGLIGRDFNPGKANIIAGTEGNDVFSGLTDGVDIVCGFAGDDTITELGAGDVFLGGEGNDRVTRNYGTFNGGEGDDFVSRNFGTFNGGPGNDRLFLNDEAGTYNGGEGNDDAFFNFGTFNGGPGDDSVSGENWGTFNGDDGNDWAAFNAGTFNGGPGDDFVVENYGVFNQ